MKEILEKRGGKLPLLLPGTTIFILCVCCLQIFFYKCPHVHITAVLILTLHKIQLKDHFLGNFPLCHCLSHPESYCFQDALSDGTRSFWGVCVQKLPPISLCPNHRAGCFMGASLGQFCVLCCYSLCIRTDALSPVAL